MARRNPNLKLYVRITPNGDVVPSTAVPRKQKPKIGRWVEIDANQCCNTEILAAELDGFPGTESSGVGVTIRCDGDILVTIQAQEGGDATTLASVVDILNSQGTSVLGTFSVTGDTISLQTASSISKMCDGELTLEISIF